MREREILVLMAMLKMNKTIAEKSGKRILNRQEKKRKYRKIQTNTIITDRSLGLVSLLSFFTLCTHQHSNLAILMVHHSACGQFFLFGDFILWCCVLYDMIRVWWFTKLQLNSHIYCNVKIYTLKSCWKCSSAGTLSKLFSISNSSSNREVFLFFAMHVSWNCSHSIIYMYLLNKSKKI